MSEWVPLLWLVAAAVALQLFMRFAWPRIRRRLAGSREAWALRHGCTPLPLDEAARVLDHSGRPGLFGAQLDGRIHAALRRGPVMLVDYGFLVSHGGSAEGTWTEPRQVTVALGDVGVRVPRLRIAPRTFARRLAALGPLPSFRLGEPAFDRRWHVSALPDVRRLLAAAGGGVSEALRAAYAIDESAVQQLLTPELRAAMSRYPKLTYEFEHNHLLVYRHARLLPNTRLEGLLVAWNDIAAVMRAAARR